MEPNTALKRYFEYFTTEDIPSFMDNLMIINEEIWASLVRATVDKKHPYRFVILATIDREKPSQRMIVLRKVFKEDRQLFFFTHFLSPKVQQIQSNSSVSCLFWHGRQNVQLRLNGEASLHHQDEIAKSYWGEIPDFRQFEYINFEPPGSLLNQPYRMDQPGKENFFCVIVVQVTDIDWLKLGRAQHQRAQFIWENNTWKTNWLVP